MSLGGPCTGKAGLFCCDRITSLLFCVHPRDCHPVVPLTLTVVVRVATEQKSFLSSGHVREGVYGGDILLLLAVGTWCRASVRQPGETVSLLCISFDRRTMI